MDYSKYVVYEVLAGSRAYGLSQPTSDVDIRGYFVAPTWDVLSLRGVPSQLQPKDSSDTVYWEVGHFLRMLLQANPNVLEVAFSPVRLVDHGVARMLHQIKTPLLSKRAYTTHVGFAHSEFKRLTARRGDNPDYQMVTKDGKEAMHALRLLISCVSILRDQVVLVDVGTYRESLLAVRNLEVPWKDIQEWYSELREGVETALKESKLPAHPDMSIAEDYLLRVRKWGMSRSCEQYDVQNHRKR